MPLTRFMFVRILGCVLLLSGCGGAEEVPEDRLTIGEFREAVRDAVNGASTEDVFFCGEVQSGTSPASVNTCVSDLFILNLPFYAFYQQTGSGTTTLAGLSMNSQGTVRKWAYNSSGSGMISSTPCEEPVFSSDPEASFGDLVTCMGD